MVADVHLGMTALSRVPLASAELSCFGVRCRRATWETHRLLTVIHAQLHARKRAITRRQTLTTNNTAHIIKISSYRLLPMFNNNNNNNVYNLG